MRKLADGGRLAAAVHPDDEDREGPARAIDHKRPLDAAQHRQKRCAKRGQQRIRVAELTALDLAVQVRQEFLGRLDADVRGEQARFQFLEQRVVYLAAGDQVRDPGGAAVDARPQPGEESAGRSSFAGRLADRRARFGQGR